MSDDVEQITKTPVESNYRTKEKDPKKVAAGKKLAEYNKRAKEALKEKMKREAEKSQEERETVESAISGGWIPEISFTTAISLVGIGLTAINMYMSYRKDTKVDPPLVRLPEPSPPAIARSQPSKIPLSKMGMHWKVHRDLKIFSLKINVEREDLQDDLWRLCSDRNLLRFRILC